MDIKYLLALHSLQGMTSLRLRRVMREYGEDFALAWDELADFANRPDFSPSAVEELMVAKAACDIELLYDKYLQSAAKLLVLGNENYPEALASIYDPPPLIFYHGELPTDDDLLLAVIGSRKASDYGMQAADYLAYNLAQEGVWVVSGMARGIDSIAHRGAIKAGGKTLAIMGSGLDVIYPAENRRLFQEIRENGAVLSEFPFGTEPFTYNFPQRNRVISGLSRGVIVVEAGVKSGTLITVDCALEQGRDVFAIPGAINAPLSAGTNRLIKQGCTIITSVDDLFAEYLPDVYQRRTKKGKAKSPVHESGSELLQLLNDPQHFDALAQRLNIQPQKLATLLSIWEARGEIRRLPGNFYQRIIRQL